MHNSTLDYAALITGLGGGLALFLYGMRKMTGSLKVAAGGALVPTARPLPAQPAVPVYLQPMFLDQPAVTPDQVRQKTAIRQPPSSSP